VIAALDQDRVARAVLTYLAEPGDPVLAALLQVSTPADLVAAVAARRLPAVPARCWDAIRGTGRPSGRSRTDTARLEHAFGTWRKRLGSVPAEMDLAGFHRDGIRLVCPGEPEWPTQLDMLGLGRPYALWLRGEADLRYCCLRSVSIVGARAATAYGAHVGTEMAAALAERGWTVVSGGAYGIDSCAHRGALAADGVTIAVVACGVDVAYPAGHADLLTAIAAQGVLVSEWPPGRTPTRRRFLIRNRVIGALSRGTVVVEAGLRSGALNTARHARDLGRPVMAVPGPVTSAVSAGCHKVIRDWGAVCVTSAADIAEMLTPLGESDLDRTSGASGDSAGPPRPESRGMSLSRRASGQKPRARVRRALRRLALCRLALRRLAQRRLADPAAALARCWRGRRSMARPSRFSTPYPSAGPARPRSRSRRASAWTRPCGHWACSRPAGMSSAVPAAGGCAGQPANSAPSRDTRPGVSGRTAGGRD
jgi:DNA processing protein